MSQEKTQVNDVCRISKGTVVKVNSWVSDADIRIDGQFYGNINTSGRVVIPELYRMITQEGYDLVSGWKN